ncbi:MAG: hypothetical protein GC172_09785 [Phycisphaera sp.]|nr:hypothetical protein [Phycisphaera sp.]
MKRISRNWAGMRWHGVRSAMMALGCVCVAAAGGADASAVEDLSVEGVSVEGRAQDAAPPAASAESQIMVTLRVFQLRTSGDGAAVGGGDAGAAAGRPQVPILKGLPFVAAKDAPEMQVAVGGKEIDRLAAEAAEHCISAPRLFVRSGREAMVEIGREVESESMQPTGEPGVFRLVRGEPRFEGMRFEVLAEAGSGGSVTIRKLAMRFSQMVGREAVEGTSLEVGAPIMRSRASTHALTLKAGQRAVLSAPALDESGETLLVVLEAAVVESPGEESKPYTKGAGGR